MTAQRGLALAVFGLAIIACDSAPIDVKDAKAITVTIAYMKGARPAVPTNSPPEVHSSVFRILSTRISLFSTDERVASYRSSTAYVRPFLSGIVK